MYMGTISQRDRGLNRQPLATFQLRPVEDIHVLRQFVDEV